MGGSPASWRQSVQIWAEHSGAAKNTWRGSIIALSMSFAPDVRPKNWRQALRFIRQYYEGNPPEPPPEPSIPDGFMQSTDSTGLPLYDSGMRNLYVKNAME